MFNIGPSEMMLLAILALLLFGPKRLPEIGRATGEAIAAFKNASKAISDDVSRQIAAENARSTAVVASEPTAALTEPAQHPTESNHTAHAEATTPDPAEHNAAAAV